MASIFLILSSFFINAAANSAWLVFSSASASAFKPAILAFNRTEALEQSDCWERLDLLDFLDLRDLEDPELEEPNDIHRYETPQYLTSDTEASFKMKLLHLTVVIDVGLIS